MKIKNPLRNVFPFNWFGDLYHFAIRLLVTVRNNMQRSIRLQLIGTFVICFLAALIVYAMTGPFFRQFSRSAVIDYNSGRSTINAQAGQMYNWTHYNQRTLAEFQEYITQSMRYSNYKILVVDLEGKVLFKNDKATETQVDIHSLISNSMGDRTVYQDSREEFTSFYPIDLKDLKAYLVVTGIPEARIIYIQNSNPFQLIIAVIVFLLLFFWFTKRKMRYVEELADGLFEISKGNLHHRVELRSEDELGSLAGNINSMASALQQKIEEERLAERTKNELITNVSHDLRTPLTLIMGYLRLLKDKNFESPQQADTYLSIAFSKSEKLKGLIDDLFEYTKVSNSGVRLTQERVCLNELLEQLMEELISYADENGLQLARELPAERLMLTIDADKMIRVFENLLSNAVKYSHKPGTVRVSLRRENDSALVCVANQGDPIPQEELPRLFDRFYRVDAARTTGSGGSGLGLAIAKSIVESHGGRIWAESDGTEIRFYVSLKLG